MSIDLTPLFQAILTVLSLLITYKLVPWLKTKLTAEKYNHLKAVTQTLVFAAEKIYGAGNGDQKLEYVVSKLEQKGFTVDRDIIESYVEELGYSLSLREIPVDVTYEDGFQCEDDTGDLG